MKKITASILLILITSLPAFGQSSDPRDQEMKEAVDGLLQVRKTQVVPLYDSFFFYPDSYAPERQMTDEELYMVLNRWKEYLESTEQVHQYILDSYGYAAEKLGEGSLHVSVIRPLAPEGRNMVFIEDKFDSRKEPAIHVSSDIVERCLEGDEGGLSYFINLFKQFYDAGHNSIAQLTDGRNILEEFLYWRDARWIQVLYIDSLLDDPERDPVHHEIFLSESFYRDQLEGYFYLLHNLDSKFILNLAHGFDLMFQSKENGGITASDYMSVLLRFGEEFASFEPDPSNEDMCYFHAVKAATMGIFYNHFLMEMACRYPIYREPPEFKQMFISACGVCRDALDTAMGYKDLLIERRRRFLSTVYDSEESDNS